MAVAGCLDEGRRDPAGRLMTYDFKDQAIRYMVTDEHRPTEVGLTRIEGLGKISIPMEYEFGSAPHCKTCKQPWPCAPITAFREFEAGQMKAHYVQMAEGGYRGEVSPW
jgi:hypothetical protein